MRVPLVTIPYSNQGKHSSILLSAKSDLRTHLDRKKSVIDQVSWMVDVEPDGAGKAQHAVRYGNSFVVSETKHNAVDLLLRIAS